MDSSENTQNPYKGFRRIRFYKGQVRFDHRTLYLSKVKVIDKLIPDPNPIKGVVINIFGNRYVFSYVIRDYQRFLTVRSFAIIPSKIVKSYTGLLVYDSATNYINQREYEKLPKYPEELRLIIS